MLLNGRCLGWQGRLPVTGKAEGTWVSHATGVGNWGEGKRSPNPHLLLWNAHQFCTGPAHGSRMPCAYSALRSTHRQMKLLLRWHFFILNLSVIFPIPRRFEGFRSISYISAKKRRVLWVRLIGKAALHPGEWFSYGKPVPSTAHSETKQ